MTERRQTARKRVYFGGRIVPGSRLSDTACLLRDLSHGGARIVVSETVPLPHRFHLVVTSRGETRTVETAWRAGDAMGVRFVGRAEDAAATLHEDLWASPAEVARLRVQLAEARSLGRPADGALH